MEEENDGSKALLGIVAIVAILALLAFGYFFMKSNPVRPQVPGMMPGMMPGMAQGGASNTPQLDGYPAQLLQAYYQTPGITAEQAFERFLKPKT